MIKILKGRKLMRAESFNYLIDYLFMYFIIILYFCYIILTINYTFWFKNELRNFGCGCRLCLEKGERLSGALESRPPWRWSNPTHLEKAANQTLIKPLKKVSKAFLWFYPKYTFETFSFGEGLKSSYFSFLNLLIINNL